MLPSSKIIPPQEIQAIREFEAKGGLFTVATGRALHAAKRYFDELDLSLPMILYNGCMVYDTKNQQYIFEHFLDEKLSLKIINAVVERFPDVGIEILCRDGVYVPKTNDVEEYHIRICQIIPKRIPMDKVPKSGWFKTLFAAEPETIKEISHFVHDMGVKSLRYVESEKHFFEILPLGVSKGSALKELLTLDGMEDVTTFAVGDYYNDLEMLAAADYAIATNNANDAVKSVADVVLDSSCEQLPITELISKIQNKNFKLKDKSAKQSVL